MHSELLHSLLTFANTFADLARSRVLELIQTDLATKWKDDNSPVTNVDRELRGTVPRTGTKCIS